MRNGFLLIFYLLFLWWAVFVSNKSASFQKEKVWNCQIMESVFLWVITSEKNNASQFILLEDQKVLKDHNSSQKPDVSFLQFGDGNQCYSG